MNNILLAYFPKVGISIDNLKLNWGLTRQQVRQLIQNEYTEVDETIDLNGSVMGADEVYHVKSTAGNFDVIPEHKVLESGTKIVLHNQIKIADNYLLSAGKDSLIGLGFNYNRNESNLICWNK